MFIIRLPVFAHLVDDPSFTSRKGIHSRKEFKWTKDLCRLIINALLLVYYNNNNKPFAKLKKKKQEKNKLTKIEAKKLHRIAKSQCTESFRQKTAYSGF